MRSVVKKTKTKIAHTYLVDSFSIVFEFDNWKIKRIDFLPIFQKYVKGENLKYLAPLLFKKFKMNNDRIFWEKNEDVSFSVTTLLDKHKKPEDIIYNI